MSKVLSPVAAIAAVVIASSTMAAASTTCSGDLASDGMTQCLSYAVGTGNPAGGGPLSTSDLFGDGMEWFELGTQLEKGTTNTITFGAFEAMFDPDGPYGAATTGTWSVNFWPGTANSEIAFVLKAGPGYAAYLMEQLSGSLSGEWSTALLTNKKDVPLGISNISVWAKPGDGEPPSPFSPPAPIPLPAAAWMLLAGIAGLYGVRRSRG